MHESASKVRVHRGEACHKVRPKVKPLVRRGGEANRRKLAAAVHPISEECAPVRRQRSQKVKLDGDVGVNEKVTRATGRHTIP